MTTIQNYHEMQGTIETVVWHMLAANSDEGRLPSALIVAKILGLKWLDVYETMLALQAQGYIRDGVLLRPSPRAIAEAQAYSQMRLAALAAEPAQRAYVHKNNEGGIA